MRVVLEEIGRVLTYERFQLFRWMAEDEIVSLLQSLAQQSVPVAGRVTAEVSRDPEDDKFLGAAIEGDVRYCLP